MLTNRLTRAVSYPTPRHELFIKLTVVYRSVTPRVANSAFRQALGRECLQKTEATDEHFLTIKYFEQNLRQTTRLKLFKRFL